MPKILIVEDDEGTREIYAHVFKKEGFEVIEAVDGTDGLDKAIKNIPDVVFSGIMMPGMNGFELFEALKKNADTIQIPFVISSHMGRPEDQQKSKDLGIKDFILRNYVTPVEVVQRIKAVANAKKYKIKFDAGALDAPKLAADLHLPNQFKCPKCGTEMIMEVFKKNELTDDFICPNCGEVQK